MSFNPTSRFELPSALTLSSGLRCCVAVAVSVGLLACSTDPGPGAAISADTTGSGIPGAGVPPSTPSATTPATPAPLQAGPAGFVAIADCLRLSGSAIATCEDDFVARYAQDTGRTSIEILDDLEGARALNSSVESACHPMSHAIGRWVFENDKTVVGSFAKCNEACHSGCYHGVMERVFQGETDHPTYEEIATQIPTICDPAQFGTPALEFQCLHGIGHAVMFSLGYDLNKSLDVCNLLVNTNGPASCQSAVFMENISAAVPELRDLDPSDPHYPCDVVDPAYARICYGMQTSVMFSYGLTEEQVASECLTGAGDYANTCISSLGRDLSSWARIGQGERMRHVCEDLATPYGSDCVWGGIAALMDNTWDGSFAIPFCNLIQGETLRNTCYYQAHYHLSGQYLFDDAGWTQQCEMYAAENLDMCLAQLPVK